MSNISKKIIVTLSILAFLIFTGQVFATSEGWKKVAENIDKDQDPQGRLEQLASATGVRAAHAATPTTALQPHHQQSHARMLD